MPREWWPALLFDPAYMGLGLAGLAAASISALYVALRRRLAAA